MKRQKPMKRTGFSTPTGILATSSFVRKKEPAPKAALKPAKVRPTALEKTWMAAVAGLGCIVCRQQGRGFVPCAVHHIVEGQRRLGHLFTIGLCDPGHHQNSPDPEQISRHPNKARFTAEYGSEYDLLAETKKVLMWSEKP